MQVRGLSYITRTFKGENVGRFRIQNLLTVGGRVDERKTVDSC